MRFVALDTETTGFNRKRGDGDVCRGHRIIEIGCVEIIDGMVTGRQFHCFLNPGRLVDPGAFKVHGISDAYLKSKPSFQSVVKRFVGFLEGAVVVIHNADFDISFIDQEFTFLPEHLRPNGKTFRFIDTLKLARTEFPGLKNDLGSLCARCNIVGRQGLHGALIDAELLAAVYIIMFYS